MRQSMLPVTCRLHVSLECHGPLQTINHTANRNQLHSLERMIKNQHLESRGMQRRLPSFTIYL